MIQAIGRGEERLAAAARGAADGLCLAAAPIFAVMGLFAGMHGGTAQDMLCAAAHGASPLGGMSAMYLLMSAVHSAPWLKLFSRRRMGARQSTQHTGG
jgi:hypothetical protein